MVVAPTTVAGAHTNSNKNPTVKMVKKKTTNNKKHRHIQKKKCVHWLVPGAMLCAACIEWHGMG